MLSIPVEQRPQAVNMFAGQFLPGLILVFEGLHNLYASMFKNLSPNPYHF